MEFDFASETLFKVGEDIKEQEMVVRSPFLWTLYMAARHLTSSKEEQKNMSEIRNLSNLGGITFAL